MQKLKRARCCYRNRAKDGNQWLGATATAHVWAVRGTVCSRFLWHAVSYISWGRHSSHAPLLYRRSSRVEMSHVLFYRNGSCMLSTKDTTHILLAIAPIGEMAPGVPWNNRSKWFRCISAPVSERWHPSKTSHRGCLKKIWKYIDKCHRTRCHPSLDYGNTVQAFAGGIPVGCEFDPNSWSSYCPYFLWWGTRSVVQ